MIGWLCARDEHVAITVVESMDVDAASYAGREQSAVSSSIAISASRRAHIYMAALEAHAMMLPSYSFSFQLLIFLVLICLRLH